MLRCKCILWKCTQSSSMRRIVQSISLLDTKYNQFTAFYFPTRNHPYNFFIPFSILDRIMSAKPSPMCSESIESRFISCPIWEHFMQNKLLAFTVPVDVIEHRPTDVCQCLTLKYKFEIDAEMCFTLSPISICHCRR